MAFNLPQSDPSQPQLKDCPPIFINNVTFTSGATSSSICTTVQSTSTDIESICNSTDPPPESAKKPLKQVKGKKFIVSKEDVSFPWYHIPANHVRCVEALASKLLSQELHTIFKPFWAENDKSAVKISVTTPSMRPSCDSFHVDGRNRAAELPPDGLTIIMPYLDWDTIQQVSRLQDAGNLLRPRTPADARSTAFRSKLLSSQSTYEFSHDIRNTQHPSRTLDQFQYSSLRSSGTRLLAQVVPKQTLDANGNAKVLVVNQLWIITSDNNSILTFFPDRQPTTKPPGIQTPQTTTLHDSILSKVRSISEPRNVCSDVYDLAALILLQTITLLLNESTSDDFRILECYHNAVGQLRQDCIQALDAFRDHELLEIDHKPANPNASKIDDGLTKVLDASSVIAELRALEVLVDTQLSVTDSYASKIWGPDWASREHSGTGEMLLREAQHKLRYFHRDLQKLQLESEYIKTDLLHLVDLRQKRANLQEARAAVKQAEDMDVQTRATYAIARSTANQSRVMIIFTFMAVVFLPLSFFTSLFAMPIREFHQPMSIWTFVKFSGPISITILFIAVVTAFPKQFYWSLRWLRGHMRRHSRGIRA